MNEIEKGIAQVFFVTGFSAGIGVAMMTVAAVFAVKKVNPRVTWRRVLRRIKR